MPSKLVSPQSVAITLFSVASWLVFPQMSDAAVLKLSAGHRPLPVEWQVPEYTGYELLGSPGDPVVVRNGADAAVSPGATQPTTFELTQPHLITQVMTYHYGAGKTPGTIAIQSQDGTVFGPWTAAGALGAGNLPNSYWWVRPDVVLPAGRYEVIDSDPSSWSTEPVTNGAGIILLWGRPQ